MPTLQVPALSYGAPEGSDVSKPPAGTFILPESALNVGFVASLYPQIDCEYVRPSKHAIENLTRSAMPDKDPVTRAKSNLLALQYDNTVSNTWRQLQRESSGDDESIKAFLDSVKALTPYIDDALLGSEYGVGGILLAPFVVSCSSRNPRMIAGLIPSVADPHIHLRRE
jgi:glutathione S-transferase